MEHRFCVENIFLEDAHIRSATASCGAPRRKCPPEILKTWKKAYLVVKVDTVKFDGQKDVTIDVEFDKPFPAARAVEHPLFHPQRRGARARLGLFPRGPGDHGPAAGERPLRRAVRLADPAGRCGDPAITGRVTEVLRNGGAVAYDLTVSLAANAKAGYSRDEINLVTNDLNPRRSGCRFPWRPWWSPR